jgi:hypothetical protein
MGATVICHGCGQGFPLPEGYGRNKIQCPGCGVICPVPAGGAPAGRAPAARPAAARAPAPAPAPAVEARSPARPARAPEPEADFEIFPEPSPRRAEPEEQAPRPKEPELPFLCRRCRRKVRRQGECPACDAEAATPLDLDGPAEPPRPEFGEGSAPAALALELDRPARPGDEEEDDSPYSYSGKDERPCPRCRRLLAPGTVVCVSCGFDRRTRKRLTKEFEPLARSWETNMPLRQRLTLFAVGQGAVLLVGLLAALRGAPLAGFLGAWAFFGLLLAFLLGTFERTDMTRDRRGRVTLTKRWRVAFVPLVPQETEVRGFGTVSSGQWQDAGFWEWFLFLWLLLPFVIPALVWWYYVIHLCAFHVALTRDHGHPEYFVYRGRRQAQMEDIAEALCGATGLRHEAA